MTESTPEAGTSSERPEKGLVPDEALPDDLRPDKNPMAAPPDDDPDGDSGISPDAGAADGAQPG
jgi:hypothetical protein